MIELELPELPLRDLTLDCTAAHRGRRGTKDGDGPAPLAGRISLGGPHALKISPAVVAADPELSAFVDQQSPFYEYHCVYLTVSFAVQPTSPRLRSAKVQLRMTSIPDSPAPVALSMKPLTVTEDISVAREVRIGPEVKLLDVELSVGEASRTTSGVRREPFLQAVGLDGTNPGWEFTRTANMNLTGAHRLVMIVKVGTGAATSLNCLVTAQTAGNISWPFARELPDPLELPAVL